MGGVCDVRVAACVNSYTYGHVGFNFKKGLGLFLCVVD